MATVDTMGVSRDAALDLMEDGDVKIGDYVLLHIGFVMNKIDEEDAMASLDTYKEIISLMDEEERQKAILEDNESPTKDADTIKAYAKMIALDAQKLEKPINIMEVCGGHTHTIMKYGIPQLMPQN
ncbi:putative multi-domain containing protein, partial [Aduncisulcus paluster]